MATSSTPAATTPAVNTTTNVLDRASLSADRRVSRPALRDEARRRGPATPAVPPPKAAAAARPPSEARLLATAVYFSGTSRLQPGGRYGISVDGDRLLVTGPFDPMAVALDRPLAGIEASVGNDRLLLSVPDGSDAIILVFTSIVGVSVDALAEAIGAVAAGSQRA